MRFVPRLAPRIGGFALAGMLGLLCLGGCLNPQEGNASSPGTTNRGGGGGAAGAGGSGGSGASSVNDSGGSGGRGGQGGSATGGASATGGTAVSGGSGGAGGSAGAGGSTSTRVTGGAGGSSARGGSTTGGTTSTGGSAGSGGAAGAGGSGGTSTRPTGGSGGRGGSSATGGITSAGGNGGTGGSAGAGGSTRTGGTTGAGGSTASGGSTGTGGTSTGTGGSGGNGGGDDGCGSELASNLTISQIAVYQTVKIPVMKSGSEVAASGRNAHVVQGHDTMFRVFVTPGSGWTARELSARLTLAPAGGTPAVYYSKKSINGASTDADQANSFQITVPASAMAASLRYAVEIVECGSQSGSAGTARFPASGDTDLGVKSPGGLKITVIPLKVGSYLPDTSETALAGYAAQMMAMYPALTVTFNVGTTLTAAVDGAGAVDWEAMLDQVQAQRTTDKPANDVYYFGLVKPADTFKNYCVRSCITGIGFVVTSATGSFSASARAAVGVGYADKQSALTLAHEVGHNHGREHAPCSVSPADAKYPYSGGLIGSWGYDARTKTLLDPAKYADIMSYCTNQWVSDYTYSAFTTRIAGVNGAALSVHSMAEEVSGWRILRVSSQKGPRWGMPITAETPAEPPETATVQDAAGATIASVTVYRIRIAGTDGAMILVPEPEPGWYAITVAGSPSIPFAPTSE